MGVAPKDLQVSVSVLVLGSHIKWTCFMAFYTEEVPCKWSGCVDGLRKVTEHKYMFGT